MQSDPLAGATLLWHVPRQFMSAGTLRKGTVEARRFKFDFALVPEIAAGDARPLPDQVEGQMNSVLFSPFAPFAPSREKAREGAKAAKATEPNPMSDTNFDIVVKLIQQGDLVSGANGVYGIYLNAR